MVLHNLTGYGWYALIAAMAGDILVSLILPLFYKGYSITKIVAVKQILAGTAM